MSRISIVIICLIAIGIQLNSKVVYLEDKYSARDSYGIFGGLNLNQHSTGFDIIPGTRSCCPGYDGGNGLGYNLGFYYNYPVDDLFEIQVRLVYSDLYGYLAQEEPIKLSNSAGEPVNGLFEYQLDGRITTFSLAPILNYKVTDQFRLHGGIRVGDIFTAQYEQIDVVTSPSFGVFQETGTRQRFPESGDIPDKNTIESALLLGASYSLPLNEENTWQLVPEAFYSFGFTNVSSTLDWTISTLSASIGLVYAPRKIKPISPPPPPAPAPPLPLPPPPPKVPVLDASVTAVSVDNDGNESPVTNITVEEFVSRKVNPLLDYIFFDEGSANLPVRYRRMSEEEKSEFSENNLYNLRTLDVYHQVLNVIGKRMSEYRQAELTLTGCNMDLGAENNNTNLSRQRAESVKSYLVSEWKIEPERIKVEARDLPNIPSNNTNLDGQAENRRVEMKANFKEIFEPLVIRDTLVVTNPPLIRFKPEVRAEVGIKQWRIVTSQSGGELKVFSGTGNPPNQLNWDLSSEKQTVPKLDEDFLYKLEIIDNDNKRWESPIQKLPVKSLTMQNKFMALLDGQVVDDKQFDLFSLISFDFNQAKLTEDHLPIIEQGKSVLKDAQKFDIEITGYSDRTGSDELNLRLSQQRADATADGLEVNRKFAKGLGKASPLYDNDLPEGRFYNRTVFIKIETTTTLDLE